MSGARCFGRALLTIVFNNCKGLGKWLSWVLGDGRHNQNVTTFLTVFEANTIPRPTAHDRGSQEEEEEEEERRRRRRRMGMRAFVILVYVCVSVYVCMCIHCRFELRMCVTPLAAS